MCYKYNYGIYKEIKTGKYHFRTTIWIYRLPELYIYASFYDIDNLVESDFGFGSDNPVVISQIKDTCTDYDENTQILSLSCLIKQYDYFFWLESYKESIRSIINPQPPDTSDTPNSISLEPFNENRILENEIVEQCFIREVKKYDYNGSIMILPSIWLFIMIFII